MTVPFEEEIYEEQPIVVDRSRTTEHRDIDNKSRNMNPLEDKTGENDYRSYFALEGRKSNTH